jgi:ribonucleoside-diphosphate reductase beta chain
MIGIVSTSYTKMPLTPIFNPQGDDSVENRTIWFGNTTNLMQLNDVRYGWAIGLYQQMRENFWIRATRLG